MESEEKEMMKAVIDALSQRISDLRWELEQTRKTRAESMRIGEERRMEIWRLKALIDGK